SSTALSRGVARRARGAMGGAWLGAAAYVAQVGNASLVVQLRELGLRLRGEDPEGLSRSNRQGWHSGFLEARPDAALAALRAELEAPLLAFAAGRGRPASHPAAPELALRVHIASLWANVLDTTGGLVAHRHAQVNSTGEDVAEVSGVFYASAGSGGLLRFPEEPGDAAGGDGQVFEPQPGVAVLFRADALHEVLPAAPPPAAGAAPRGPGSSTVGGREPRISFSFNVVTRPLVSALDRAAARGDVRELERLARPTADVSGAGGFTALHHAAEAGHAPAAELLLSRRAAEPRAWTPGGRQAVHLAVAAGSVPVVELLLESDPAACAARGASGTTPAHIAAANGDVALLRKLRAAGADLRSRSDEGQEPLHAAVRNGHLPVVSLLLSEGADANLQDEGGLRPLHEAARGGLGRAAELLLAARADPLGGDAGGRPALFWAAHGGHAALLGLLSRGPRALPDALRSPAALAGKGGAAAGSRGEAVADYLAAAMVGEGGDLRSDPDDLAPMSAIPTGVARRRNPSLGLPGLDSCSFAMPPSDRG
ncbi:unnamed protein product, partial [Prorocentrum cordatum]